LLLGALLVAAAAAATGVLAVWQDRRELEARAAGLTGGDPHAGREAIALYGCGVCHTVPGVRRAQGMVGPPLTAFAKRIYVAGKLPNSPDNLIHWILDPQAVSAATAMPNTGVTEGDARDIAAYLYTLR
jgi:cytochrome c1